MNAFDSQRVRFQAVSSEDRQMIRSELDELTRNMHFAGSKRYPALLRYVVEKTLDGKMEELKERTVGIEVFHRPPDYDTNNDTVVRVTAGEVRKRLALTYHEAGQRHAVQILLPAGSYIPEFYRTPPAGEGEGIAETEGKPTPSQEHRLADLAPANLAGHRAPSAHGVAEEQGAPSPVSQPAGRVWRNAAILLLVALGGAWMGEGFAAYRTDLPRTSVDRFWLPLHQSGVTALFCAGALIPSATVPSGFTEADKRDDYPYISMATAAALTSIGNQLSRSHTGFIVQPASSTSLTDMRLHPTVLVGAYDNKWTILMLKDLRFRFADKPMSQIYDAKVPGKVWQRVDALPYKDKDDYAIIARFHDKVTDNMIVVVAGLGKNGTEAAAQFVTTPRYLDLLNSQLHGDLASKNIEVVLKTAVVDSKTGAPSVEAIDIW